MNQGVGDALRPVDQFMRPAYPVTTKVGRGLKEGLAIGFWMLLYLLVWGWVWALGGYLAFEIAKEIWPF
ncbi:MAG: hypothetical protein ACKOB2_00665 [Solirubrobacterales bacterium]